MYLFVKTPSLPDKEQITVAAGQFLIQAKIEFFPKPVAFSYQIISIFRQQWPKNEKMESRS